MRTIKVILAALLAIAVAAPAMAVQFKVNGDFNNRFTYSTQADLVGTSSDSATYVNVSTLDAPDTKKESKDSDFFGELKYRLWMTASDDEQKVKAVLAVEAGGSKFGSTDADFGGDAKGEDSVFEFRWGYIDFEVPFDPASRVSMGLQPVKYNKWVWSDNAAGVKWSAKRGDLAYSLGWWRNDVDNGGKGGADKLKNDDVYAFDVTYTLQPGNKFNGFVMYRESGQEEIDGVSDVMDQETWIGISGQGAVNNLFGGFTFIYLTGEIDGDSAFASSASGDSSLDREAFLVNLEGTVKLDRSRVKLGWTYASGDDDATDDDVENFDAIDNDSAVFGSVILFDGYADDNNNLGSTYVQDRGLNTVYLRGEYDLNEKTTLGAGYLWANTAEDIIKDSDLGHEFIVDAGYKIAKGFNADIRFGYLVGGDAWDELASDGDGDDVFRTDFRFRYKF